MQEFIKKQINIRAKIIENNENIKTCSKCGANEKTFFRNFMNTLECMCGMKFYGR